MSRIAMATVLALLLVPVAAVPEDSQQKPQIRVSTRLVEIGVIVRDKNGPVANLTKSDFTVLDRGKPQPISIFSADTAASTQQPPQQPLPQSTFSNLSQYAAARPRSVTIVLLDNLNTLFGSAAQPGEVSPYWIEDLALQNGKSHLIPFIQGLQPQDRVAIYGLRNSLHVLCDFTCNRDQLLTVLKTYDTTSVTNREIVEPGRFTFPGMNAAALRMAKMANAERFAKTMAALSQIVAHVANIPGRKNLVWLTANLPFSDAAMAHLLSPANIAAYPVDVRGLLTKSIMPSNADADEVSSPIVTSTNMPAQTAQPIGITTMQNLADETGGQAFVNTNDLTGAIRAAVEDSAVTYTLGFYIDRSVLDGKFHGIKVKVQGSGLTVRYPSGYFAYPDTAATKDEEHARLGTAVESPIESSVIPLEATVERMDQPRANFLNLVCSIDLHDVQFTQSGSLRQGAVVVYVIEQDKTGKVLWLWDERYKLRFTDSHYAALLKSGLSFRQNVQPRPGTTTLRVLVEDPATSEIGSIIIPLSQVN